VDKYTVAADSLYMIDAMLYPSPIYKSINLVAYGKPVIQQHSEVIPHHRFNFTVCVQ